MKKTTLLSAFAVLGLTLAAASVRAETQWQQNHPRRTQVNGRMKNQNRRIRQGVKNGTLSHKQARQLHQEHQEIRHEERADAAAHGGHITRQEQRQINRQENQESRQIYNEKH